MSEITIPHAAEMIDRKVKPDGASAKIGVPKRWIGRKVAVVLFEDRLGGDARTPQH